MRRLHTHLTRAFPYPFRITIADNASTDARSQWRTSLPHDLPCVRVVHLPQKGRGRALHAVWSTSDAPVLAYMDVDLSTDLDGLLPLVAPLISGHSDVAIGTRLARGARVVRGPKREVDLALLQPDPARGAAVPGSATRSAGSRPSARDAARQLLPLVEDTGWFFDTELLVLAERAGMRIHEVPVDWVDDPDSRSTSWRRRRPTSGVCCACWVASRAGGSPSTQIRAGLGHGRLAAAARPAAA